MSGYSIYENTFSQKSPSKNAAVPSTKSSTFATLKGSPFSPATITSGGNDERNPPSLENMGVNRFNTLRAVSVAIKFVISVSKGLAGIDDHGVLY
jgi:hypothetical protein